MEEDKKKVLLEVLSIVKSGYAGILSNGMIVDRRKHPEAIPCQRNALLGNPEPKEIK